MPFGSEIPLYPNQGQPFYQSQGAVFEKLGEQARANDGMLNVAAARQSAEADFQTSREDAAIKATRAPLEQKLAELQAQKKQLEAKRAELTGTQNVQPAESAPVAPPTAPPPIPEPGITTGQVLPTLPSTPTISQAPLFQTRVR